MILLDEASSLDPQLYQLELALIVLHVHVRMQVRITNIKYKLMYGSIPLSKGIRNKPACCIFRGIHQYAQVHSACANLIQVCAKYLMLYFKDLAQCKFA